MKLLLLALLFVPHKLPAPEPRPLQVGDRVIVQLEEHAWSDVGVVTEFKPNSLSGDSFVVETQGRTFEARWYMVKRLGR